MFGYVRSVALGTEKCCYSSVKLEGSLCSSFEKTGRHQNQTDHHWCFEWEESLKWAGVEESLGQVSVEDHDPLDQIKTGQSCWQVETYCLSQTGQAQGRLRSRPEELGGRPGVP